MEIWEAIKTDPVAGARMLIDEYGDRLYSAALILVHESHGAEDLVSRTICRAVAKIGGFTPSYSFWNWLYTIMLNFYRTDLRKHKAEVAHDSDFVERRMERISAEAEMASAFSEVDAALLRDAVARLPPVMRTVVMLRYFEDKTLAEMVKIMGVPSGTVKTHLHRARSRLKAVLADAFKEGAGK